MNSNRRESRRCDTIPVSAGVVVVRDRIHSVVSTSARISVLQYHSCHSNDPTMAVRPAKDPWLGASTVIRRLGMSSAVLQTRRESIVWLQLREARAGGNAHNDESDDGEVEHLFVVALCLVGVGRREQCEHGVVQPRAGLRGVDQQRLHLGHDARGADGQRGGGRHRF